MPGPIRSAPRVLPLAVALFVVAPRAAALFVAPRPAAAEAGSGESVRLRVLTYNIHHGQGTDGRFDLERLATIIDRLDPDLVALQEVDCQTTRAAGVDQAARLGNLTHRHAIFGKAMSFAGGDYGEAILCRDRPLAYGTHALPHDPAREPRAALTVRLRVKTGEVILFTATHLDHLPDDTDRLAQVAALDRILAAGRPRPVILAGDFNARPESRPMQELLSRWCDTCAVRPAPTAPAKRPQERIDYVLVWPPERWRVIESRVIEERTASDHRPLLVVLELLAPHAR